MDNKRTTGFRKAMQKFQQNQNKRRQAAKAQAFNHHAMQAKGLMPPQGQNASTTSAGSYIYPTGPTSPTNPNNPNMQPVPNVGPLSTSSNGIGGTGWNYPEPWGKKEDEYLAEVGFVMNADGDYIMRLVVDVKLDHGKDVYGLVFGDCKETAIKAIKHAIKQLKDKLTAKKVLANLLSPKKIKDE